MKILASVLMMLSCASFADVVVMKNGDQMTGTVDSISGGHLLLNTEYAGAVPIKLDAIAYVTTEAAFDVRVGEQKLHGNFAVADQTALIGDQPVELAAIKRAGQNNVAGVDLGTDWSSRADVGVVISNGNSDTESINALIESALKLGKSEHSVSLLVSREEAEEETTKDQTDFDYGYKRFLSDKWYAAGNFEYFKDELKDIDQRLTLGVGMGYQFWDDSLGALSVEAGVSAVREELDGEEEDNPAFRWALDYKRLLMSKKMEFFHKHAILVIPDSDRGEVISGSTGLRYAISDRIDTSARVDVIHETEPAPGNSKTDVTYTLGVGVKF